MVSSDSVSKENAQVDPYTLEGASHRKIMQGRTSAQQGEFFLPYLKANMRLLDAGCGGGSITLGLAEVVTPGEVTGLDVNDPQIQIATKAASERGLRNVRFQLGNVYELPFPDRSFDAVFSNALLEHLSEPERALHEFHRVLKSPGVVGVRITDVRGTLLEPADPALLEMVKYVIRLVKHQGGNFEMGSDTMRLLRKSGFVEVEAGATYECYTTMDDRRRWADMEAAMCRESTRATQMTELGWVDSDKLERWARAWLAWAENPDAFLARSYVHGLGHKS